MEMEDPRKKEQAVRKKDVEDMDNDSQGDDDWDDEPVYYPSPKRQRVRR